MSFEDFIKPKTMIEPKLHLSENNLLVHFELNTICNLAEDKFDSLKHHFEL